MQDTHTRGHPNPWQITPGTMPRLAEITFRVAASYRGIKSHNYHSYADGVLLGEIGMRAYQSLAEPAKNILPERVAAKVREGHTLVEDPPHPLSSVTRWTCERCGAAALDSGSVVYGSATQEPCAEPNQVGERW